MATVDLPREFRLFRAGSNRTSKGTFLFDTEAARSVMAAYRQAGTDVMIDLEHQSLSADASARPDSADARGWFKLELRNGELWAVNVTWTPDGARRLSERTQRYISPTFLHDALPDGSKRVVELLNVALVAMPATHSPHELVAASRGGRPIASLVSPIFTAPKRSTVMVAARVATPSAKRFYALARQAGQTPGAMLRNMVALALEGKKSPQGKLALVASALGLPDDSSFELVMAALQELNAQLAPAPGTEPTDESAAPPPAAKLTANLTDRERAECRRRGIDLAQFAARKACAVRRVK